MRISPASVGGVASTKFTLYVYFLIFPPFIFNGRQQAAGSKLKLLNSKLGHRLPVLVLTVLLAFQSEAQTLFYGSAKTLTAQQDSTMDANFDAYQAFKVSLPQLNQFVKSQSETGAALTLQIGEQFNWQLNLKLHEIRVSNYLVQVETENGTLLRKKDDCNTYKGFVNGDTTLAARLFISDNYLHGFILYDEEMYIIEPLRQYLGDAADGRQDFVVYKRRDAKEDPLVCFTETGVEILNGDPPLIFRGDECPLGPCSGFNPAFPTVTRYLELATEADCEFVSANGGESSTKDKIESLANMLDELYFDAVNLHVILVYQHLWANCSTLPDPFSGTDMIVHWETVRNWWNQNMEHIHRDHVHFFSGKNLSPGNGVADGSGIFSSVGATCVRDEDYNANGAATDYRYESYTVSDGPSTFRTFAHEIGHALGMGHTCDCGLMESGGCANPCPTFSSTCMSAEPSQRQLCQFLNNFNSAWDYAQDACLTFPPPLNYEFEVIVSANQVLLLDGDLICQGQSLTATFANTFNEYDITWLLGPGLSFASDPDELVVELVCGTNQSMGTYIGVTFDYNGQQLTFYRYFHIGIPLPVGPPIISPNSGYPTTFNIGFPMPPGADFIQYSYTITVPNQYPETYSGTTTNALPLAANVPSNACIKFSLYPVNECGTNTNPPYPYIEICFSGSNPLIKNPDKPQAAEAASGLPEKAQIPQPPSTDSMQGFSVQPNPAGNRLFISLPVSTLPADLRVWDLTGKEVHQQNIPGKQTILEVNSSNWQNGVYYLQLIQGSQIHTAKIVVNK